MFQKNPQRQRGFTLIEILVSTLLFTVASGSIIGTYNYIIRLNRRAQTIRMANDSARYLLEVLTREIRNGKLQYAGRPSVCGNSIAIPQPSAYVAIINNEQESECFYLSDNTGSALSPLDQYLWVAKNNGATSLPPTLLTPPGVTVQGLNFYVSPTTDPYLAGSVYPETVTISGSIVASPGPKDVITIPFQTTIVLPLYDIPQA